MPKSSTEIVNPEAMSLADGAPEAREVGHQAALGDFEGELAPSHSFLYEEAAEQPWELVVVAGSGPKG